MRRASPGLLAAYAALGLEDPDLFRERAIARYAETPDVWRQTRATTLMLVAAALRAVKNGTERGTPDIVITAYSDHYARILADVARGYAERLGHPRRALNDIIGRSRERQRMRQLRPSDPSLPADIVFDDHYYPPGSATRIHL